MSDSQQSERSDASWIDARLLRMIRKEVSSILRDRRTIITLVLMPLLLYPLLSLAFQQLFLASNLEKSGKVMYRLGVSSKAGRALLRTSLLHGAQTELLQSQPGMIKTLPEVTNVSVADRIPIVNNFNSELLNDKIDLGVEILDAIPPGRVERRDRLYRCRLVYNKSAQRSVDAYHYVHRLLTRSNHTWLIDRIDPSKDRLPFHMGLLPALNPEDILARQQNPPAALVLSTYPDPIEDPEGATVLSLLSSLVPLILILMTITGAVYPAIDLTAGERERGTLEILVAAPVPRMGLLFAKYISVLVVAVLTAFVNIATMTLSLKLTGLGQAIFQGRGLNFVLILQILFLLVLFATFFSAVLLAVTSFARSFKEAQVYLIPLMLISLAPGLVSLLPGWHLEGPILVVPLLNIVLLARDIFAGDSHAGATIVVVLSTLFYALSAISLAARLFGAEAVLYNEQGTWADLVRRPLRPVKTPSPSSAMFCLALIFPLSFLLVNGLGSSDAIPFSWKLLALQPAISLILFLLFPLFLIWWGRAQIATTFRATHPAVRLLVPSLLLGMTLWCFQVEIIALLRALGIQAISDKNLESAGLSAARLRMYSPLLIVFLLGVIPPATEELFFRGYLFSAIRSRSNNRSAILATSLLFGLFHLVTPYGLAFEKMLSAAILGLVLGWLAARSGSVLPGIVLHAFFNTSITLLTYFKPELEKAGWIDSNQVHVPALWLLTAGLIAVPALIYIYQVTSALPENDSELTELHPEKT